MKAYLSKLLANEGVVRWFSTRLSLSLEQAELLTAGPNALDAI